MASWQKIDIADLEAANKGQWRLRIAIEHIGEGAAP
jgi:hypothetical protein